MKYVVAILLMFSSSLMAAPTLQPGDGANIDSDHLLRWSDTDTGSNYWVMVGSAAGLDDIANTKNLGNVFEYPLNGLSGDVHVTLWYRPSGQSWQSITARYTVMRSLVSGSGGGAACPEVVVDIYQSILDHPRYRLGLNEGLDLGGCLQQFRSDSDRPFSIAVKFAGVISGDDGYQIAHFRGPGANLPLTDEQAAACAIVVDCP